MEKQTAEKEAKHSLQGKTAIVTGGGRGIGSATSKLLASRGANVVVNYLSNKESAEHIVAEIKTSVNTNGNAVAIQADVRDASQVQHMTDQTIRQFGRVEPYCQI